MTEHQIKQAMDHYGAMRTITHVHQFCERDRRNVRHLPAGKITTDELRLFADRVDGMADLDLLKLLVNDVTPPEAHSLHDALNMAGGLLFHRAATLYDIALNQKPEYGQELGHLLAALLRDYADYREEDEAEWNRFTGRTGWPQSAVLA